MDAAWLDTLFKRQDEIFALQPQCPNCETRQVQIINLRAVPAEWRCRMCKAQFTAEPAR